MVWALRLSAVIKSRANTKNPHRELTHSGEAPTRFS